MLAKVLSPAYFAREDTRTPMLYATVNMIINVVLSVALFFWFKAQGWMPHLGIAVATTVAGWINAIQLWWTLHRRGEFHADARLLRTVPMIILSSVVMGGVLYGLGEVLKPWLTSGNVWVRVAALGGLVSAGLVSYAVLVFGTGIFKVSQLNGLRQKRGQAAVDVEG